MATLTSNDMKILSSVISNPKYGLEILADVTDSGAKFSLGSLYNALNRLERDGFLKSSWGEDTAERGGNRRRYYEITAQGSAAVTEFQISFAKLWNWNWSPAFSF